MTKSILLFLMLAFALPVLCQEGITFKVEELSKPEKLLPTTPSKDVYKKLLQADAKRQAYNPKKEQPDVVLNIIAQSELPKEILAMGYHSFFYGMYWAYAGHRPFVMSPDMIWLLICQGFAQHVNANPEILREHFVDFTKKMTLVVRSADVSLSAPASRWQTIFPKFIDSLSANVKGNVIEVLSADFSTTTPVEKIASQITIMESMKSYFEFVHIRLICGIPEITLKGTTEDWQKILDKTKQLAQYDLEWWTKEMEPLLEEFVKASQGDIDTTFWMNMFKQHTSEKYGSPKVIDGWIVKFFPYDKYNKRNNLQNLIGKDRLPDEIVKVDMKHIEPENGEYKTTELELWAGFVGVEQNKKTFALTPKIGWMIRKKDIENTRIQQEITSLNDAGNEIHIRVNVVPDALFMMKHIKNLSIDFIGNILIPDTLANTAIDKLTLRGEITDDEILRIRNMFPKTELRINNKAIGTVSEEANQ